MIQNCETVDPVLGTQIYKVKIPKNISYKHDYAYYKYQSNLSSKIMNSGFGGLEVACWPLVPKFAGSSPARRGAWIFVCCDCCVLSGRGLCDELITRSEEFYRLWCVVVCDLETS